MRSNKKKSIKDTLRSASYPDKLASDEQKATEEYGIAMGNKILQEWFQNSTFGGSGSYSDNRAKYHELRSYARGEQDVQTVKDLLDGDDSTYTNYDWTPIQILPKFVKLIVNQMSERLFDIKAEATDKYSTDLKDTYKRNLENTMMAKPIIKEAKNTLGVDLVPEGLDSYPDSQEEIDLHMRLKYKPAIEIAAEEAIKYTLDLNDYPEIQNKALEDIVTLGICAVKHNTHPIKGITIEYVDPANLVYSAPTHRNFKDVHYYGEVERMTINDLQVLSQGKFTKDELEDIQGSAKDWNNYQGTNNTPEGMVDVLHFNFKSVNTVVHKKRNYDSGVFKMSRKESTFDKKDRKSEIIKKQIDVWYQGSIIMGTDKIFNYGLCENMIRPNGLLNRTSPNYLVYAPDIYQGVTKSLVSGVVGYIRQVQQIHIKIQQLIAKVKPSGISIDITGLTDIDYGDGNMLTPLELVKIYNETGNAIWSSKDAGGDFSGGVPIQELRNGVTQGLSDLINTYNHYINLIRDSIGISAGADATLPHPDTLVGVQEQAAISSNIATRHVLESVLNISERLGECLSLRIKDIFKYSDLKQTYINAIGKLNVEVLKALENYHLHDLGINIVLKPDLQEKQNLENNISIALQRDLITLDDAIDIRSTGNIKLANARIKISRVRREKEKREYEMQLEQSRSQAQVQVQQASAQAKQAEIQAKTQAALTEIQAKAEMEMKKIEAEKLAKSQLMEQEFQYNLQLNGMEVQNQLGKEKYKEDRKDNRQDRNNSQASKLVEQRNFNKPALNFESSEDSITGGIDMGDMNPS